MHKQSFTIQDGIAAFSRFFSKRYRITLLLIVVVLALGYMTYTQFLKREGLPAIEIPIAIIQTPYVVQDEHTVDQDVTIPLERELLTLPEARSTSSQSLPNVSIIQVNFSPGTNSSEGVRILKEHTQGNTELPEAAQPDFIAINTGSFDGRNDIVVTLYGENDNILETQDMAARIASRVERLPEVKSSSPVNIINERTDPLTGQTVMQQEGVNRVGIKKNDVLQFYNGIHIGIAKTQNSSIVEASDAVRSEIERMEDRGDLEGYAVVYGLDMAQIPKDQIAELESAALTSLIAVIVVLLLLLNWRASVIGALFIPIVFAATFIGLYAIGYELNTMVLFGLVLVLGLFVDDAIVVVESIDYHKRRGEKGAAAVSAAIKDIGLPDILGTVTTLLVFVPMAMISGIMGDFIKFIPITIIIALSLSLLIALTIITFLSGAIVPNYTKKRKRGIFFQIEEMFLYKAGDAFNSLSSKVGSFVSWYICRPLWASLIFVISIMLIGVGGYYATQLKFSIFAPPKDSDNIIIQYEFAERTSIEDQETILQKTEEIILKNAEQWIEEVNYISTGEGAFQLLSLQKMSDRDIQAPDITTKLNEAFEGIENVNIRSSVYSAGPPDTSDYRFFVQIYSDNEQQLMDAAEELASFLEGKEVLGEEKAFDTEIEFTSSIARRNGERYVQVKAKVTDTQNSEILIALEDEVRQHFNESKLEELGLDPERGIRFDLGLETEFMESFDSAIFYFYISLLAMYILLVLLYNSFSLPLLVLLAIPFSFAGIFPGLYLTNNEMSFFVVVGLIALSGIVVNNTIMLLDFANRKRNDGASIKEAISDAIAIRFRPIMITTVTTIAALIPLSLVDPFWEPLVYTIIFGLSASTILAIFAFPVYYCIIERMRGIKTFLAGKFDF